MFLFFSIWRARQNHERIQSNPHFFFIYIFFKCGLQAFQNPHAANAISRSDAAEAEAAAVFLLTAAAAAAAAAAAIDG